MIPLLLRFSLVGSLGFLVDAAVTLALERGAGFPAHLARPPAIALAMLVTWWFNRRFAFRVDAPIESLVPYAMVAACAALLNYLLFVACIAGGLGTVASILVATGVSMVFSFVGYRRYAFSGSGNRVSSPPQAGSCRSIGS